VQFVGSDTVSSVSETIFIQGHIRELKKKLSCSFHLERAVFMEASREDNHGLPYAQAFAYLLCTHARFQRSWFVALLVGRGGGGDTNYPEHQICVKVTVLISYTDRRRIFKMSFEML
jgi:hypothetical protein